MSRLLKYLRNPAPIVRVGIVALLYAVLGTLGGAMLSLFVGTSTICIIAGMLVGAVTGAVLEAWPDIIKHR